MFCWYLNAFRSSFDKKVVELKVETLNLCNHLLCCFFFFWQLWGLGRFWKMQDWCGRDCRRVQPNQLRLLPMLRIYWIWGILRWAGEFGFCMAMHLPWCEMIPCCLLGIDWSNTLISHIKKKSLNPLFIPIRVGTYGWIDGVGWEQKYIYLRH